MHFSAAEAARTRRRYGPRSPRRGHFGRAAVVRPKTTEARAKRVSASAAGLIPPSRERIAANAEAQKSAHRLWRRKSPASPDREEQHGAPLADSVPRAANRASTRVPQETMMLAGISGGAVGRPAPAVSPAWTSADSADTIISDMRSPIAVHSPGELGYWCPGYIYTQRLRTH